MTYPARNMLLHRKYSEENTSAVSLSPLVFLCWHLLVEDGKAEELVR